ncbi:hypothetical protein J8J42_07760 [Chryseobacterium sp. cx-311]|uniref:hypothetical protein n=1 Tax=Marnyiella aurantia TaxID=2758037 RepID=UPI001AE47C7F|nr:hypothetical protein [Marnyiella aurantia]MBP0612939.1 hypothetical protein [Marnyiella aurantia]
MLEPVEKFGLSYSFYDVDDHLEPVFDYGKIQDNEVFLITNYFGVKGQFIRNIAGQIRNVVVDNAQALFEQPLPGIDTLYSPRKFVGVADGGYVSTSAKLHADLVTDQSFERMSHLLKRADLGSEAGYEDFKINDISLENQPIKRMSNLTKKILAGLDYGRISVIRQENFAFLHHHLGASNILQIDIDSSLVPMVYPYRCNNAGRIKSNLVKNKIFCATYWPNVADWCNEQQYSWHLTNEIIALPVDQRYNTSDMNKLIQLIKK